MALLPRVIYSAWLQGAAQAPAIVQLCFERWTRLHPEYQLRVLEASDAAAILAPHNLPEIPPQALSDIVRVKLLLEHGGIWVDASLFPVVPLRHWLPVLLAGTELFAFVQPGPDRPISSWFMAAPAGSLIMHRLWEEVLRFWHKPRRLAQYNGSLIPSHPAASVAPRAGGASDNYPYFWLHYLFRYLLETDAAFAAAWALGPQIPAEPAHQLQALCANPAPDAAVMAAARTAPVQKLSWRANYPLDVLARL